MTLAIVESPYAGDVERNRAYLNDCIAWAVANGYSPYASHKMLTDSLDDLDPMEREYGIRCGYEWWDVVPTVLFFTDLGWSDGMYRAKHRAETHPLMYIRVISLKEKGFATTHLNRCYARRNGDTPESLGVQDRLASPDGQYVRGGIATLPTVRSPEERAEGEQEALLPRASDVRSEPL